MARKTGFDADETRVSIDSRIDLSSREAVLQQYSALQELSLAGGVEEKSFEQAMRILKAARETICESDAAPKSLGAPGLRDIGGGKRTSSPFGG